MPHDVFISYAADDKPVADAACAVMERRGWSNTAMVQQVPWRVTLYVMPNGRFELNSRVDDTGTFSVQNGTWYLKSARGFPQNGTYTRVDGRTVTMTGPLGTATWTKQ